MDFVSVGYGSRDKVHVCYKGRVATFYGEDGLDCFAVWVNGIEWYPKQPATVEEKIELMTVANKTFHGKQRLVFFENDMVMFDWEGKPLIYVEKGKIKELKIPCVCSALTEINHFESMVEYERFNTYLKDILQLKLLKKKFVYKVIKGRKTEKYQCQKCKGNWILTNPKENFCGSWKKDSKANFILGFKR